MNKEGDVARQGEANIENREMNQLVVSVNNTCFFM